MVQYFIDGGAFMWPILISLVFGLGFALERAYSLILSSINSQKFYEDISTILEDESVRLIGVEASGHGVETGMHAAALNGGEPGILHGNRTYLLQDDDGQILEGFSISAGLDYPGIGPEHSWLHDIGRAKYVSITDREALEAFQLCCSLEGIIPALEPSHALAHVMKIAPELPKDHLLVMNMCGRGDKDIFTVARALDFDMGEFA